MKLKYKMEIMELDGGPVAIPVDTDNGSRCVLHLNNTALDILSLLEKDVTEGEIISALKKEYDASEEQLKHSVQRVIAVLKEHNLM